MFDDIYLVLKPPSELLPPPQEGCLPKLPLEPSFGKEFVVGGGVGVLFRQVLLLLKLSFLPQDEFLSNPLSL